MESTPLLFISHASVDVQVAEFLESQVRRSIAGLEVFRTSRAGQISPGVEWATEVKDRLREAALFLILLTPSSVSRPWVLFETGAAWMARKPLVPVLAGGLRNEGVPEPLNTLQLLSIEDPVQAAEAFRALGGTLREPQAFAARVHELGASARERALAKDGWERLQFEGNTYAWEGPLHELPEGPPFPVPDGLLQMLVKEGIHGPRRFPDQVPSAELQGYRQLYMLDKLGRKCRVTDGLGEVLMVQPRSSKVRRR
jgi:hypothetical protein